VCVCVCEYECDRSKRVGERVLGQGFFVFRKSSTYLPNYQSTPTL